MPTHIHDSSTSGTALTGTYNYQGGVFIVPSGENPPAVTEGGHLYFVPQSGLLLMSSGIAWTTFQLVV